MNKYWRINDTRLRPWKNFIASVCILSLSLSPYRYDKDLNKRRFYQVSKMRKREFWAQLRHLFRTPSFILHTFPPGSLILGKHGRCNFVVREAWHVWYHRARWGRANKKCTLFWRFSTPEEESLERNVICA